MQVAFRYFKRRREANPRRGRTSKSGAGPGQRGDRGVSERRSHSERAANGKRGRSLTSCERAAQRLIDRMEHVEINLDGDFEAGALNPYGARS